MEFGTTVVFKTPLEIGQRKMATLIKLHHTNVRSISDLLQFDMQCIEPTHTRALSFSESTESAGLGELQRECGNGIIFDDTLSILQTTQMVENSEPTQTCNDITVQPQTTPDVRNQKTGTHRIVWKNSHLAEHAGFHVVKDFGKSGALNFQIANDYKMPNSFQIWCSKKPDYDNWDLLSNASGDDSLHTWSTATTSLLPHVRYRCSFFFISTQLQLRIFSYEISVWRISGSTRLCDTSKTISAIKAW